ncbi:zinc metalloproteinase nas-13 [Nephila pilipes]|uniref:Metalloendopeptidase n=1 Tax=Nephila pilipes TaxID=299642 RepID=A0A8X6UJP2_NEPPI|nr:zinc metalloproteinase nas-13 [Nephila pilipes]
MLILLDFFLCISFIKVNRAAVEIEEIGISAVDIDHELDEEMQDDDGFYEHPVDHEKQSMHIHLLVKAEFRNAISDPKRFWKEGVVPYKISKKYNAKLKKGILHVMEEFKHKTCIRFVPKTSNAAYIFIAPGSGCSATVGMLPQGKVSLGRGCNNKGIIIHEFMHILGFFHEHSRPDRDKYVTVNWENISERSKKNFRKFPENLVQNGNIAYDYDSIMHYGSHSFAKNRSIPTLTPLQENITIGQRDGFSKHDLEKIHHLYNCKNITSTTTKMSEITKPSNAAISSKELLTTEQIGSTSIIPMTSVITASPSTSTSESTDSTRVTT